MINYYPIRAIFAKTTGQFTAIIECTSNGGFKFIPLEGKGEIFPDKGKSKEIYRGRLTMVLGSPSKLGNAYDIDLLLLLKSVDNQFISYSDEKNLFINLCSTT